MNKKNSNNFDIKNFSPTYSTALEKIVKKNTPKKEIKPTIYEEIKNLIRTSKMI